MSDETKFIHALKSYSRYFSQSQVFMALQYHKEGHAYLEVNERRVTGIVQGLEDITYRVNLEFDRNKVNIFTSDCTCESTYNCVHILVCAALWGAGQNRIDRKNLPLLPEKLEKIFIPGKMDISQKTNTIFFTKEISTPLPKSRGEWKMIFVFESINFVDFHGPGVIPKLQFVKKNGDMGRVEDYNPYKKCLPIESNFLELYLWFQLRNFNYIPWGEFWHRSTEHMRAGICNIKGQSIKVQPAIRIIATPKIAAVPDEKKEIVFNLTWLVETESDQIIPNRANPFLNNIWFFNEVQIAYKTLESSQISSLITILNKTLWTHHELISLNEELEAMPLRPFELNYNVRIVRVTTQDFQPVWKLYPTTSSLMEIHFGAWSFENGIIQPYAEFTQGVNGEEINVYPPINNIIKEFAIRSIDKLALLGLKPLREKNYDGIPKAIVEVQIQDFLIRFGKILIDEGVGISLLGKPPATHTTKIAFHVSSGIDWFDVEIQGTEDFEGAKGYLTQVGGGWIQVGDRLVFASEADQKTINVLARLGWKGESSLRVLKSQFSQIEALFSERETPSDIAAWLKVGAALREGRKLEPIHPTPNFMGNLRDYQGTGLAWLWFLHTHGLNGLLADDMGLGKTIQTLAFLANWISVHGDAGRFLLITPVTTIPNWERETKRFLPSIAVTRHQGNERKKTVEALPEVGLVLVSYQTYRIDVEIFTKQIWDVVILDEAQTIKNAASQTFKSVCLLKAATRLSLTGTPVENNIGDLWSQMDFLNPGLLGERKFFMRRYSDDLGRLKAIVAPFILRRKKQDVLKDLPDKEEIILYCEMGKEQRAFYHNLREKILASLGMTLAKKSILSAQMEILTAILRLRQACLFPALAETGKGWLPSTKMDALSNILGEILSENHKVLIFSQFTQALGIIGDEIRKDKIEYLYLDGKTKDRASIVDRFQQQDNERVFLISLKAGGVGINLTAADYVVVFDPWWNPAVENQAVDRTHRIGQKNKVTVYKLVVTESIEEKILQLQETKKHLVTALISEEKTALKDMSVDEVLNLFRE